VHLILLRALSRLSKLKSKLVELVNEPPYTGAILLSWPLQKPLKIYVNTAYLSLPPLRRRGAASMRGAKNSLVEILCTSASSGRKSAVL
jgi:hypothetical protein